jgi:hypothetical protein
MIYVKRLANKLTYAAHNKTLVLPEDGQELRPKHVGAIINKKIVQQVYIKYYIINEVLNKTQRTALFSISCKCPK